MPVSSRVRGSGLRLRPFYTTVFLLTLFATWSYFTKATERRLDLQDAASPLSKRAELTECRDVHLAADQCAFVKAHCAEDEAGLLSYLTLYYCDFGKAQTFAFILLVCWLGLLFTTIGIAASDFFSVNLNTISTILGLSESLAGVTFLAFGNGSPDVFSTFAAMGSNSASMAVGELIGAASFITAVVAGSMALVREFKVGRKTYVRDLCFFIVAVCFTMVFLADGHLHLWECITMVCYYIFYVATVVSWHWYSTRRSQRRVREAAARGHVYGAVGHPNDELASEPYRDDPDDEDRRITSAAASNAGDISALEAGLRIDFGDDEDVDDVEESEHGRHVVAEMASNMRVLRPRGRRRNTLTPIRPSLVGALEFRSALAQLQRESNHRMRPIHGRAYSVNHIGGSHSETATVMGPPSDSGRYTISAIEGLGQDRNRAMSSGDVPGSVRSRSRDHSPWRFPPQENSSNPIQQVKAQEARHRSQSPAYKIGGNLAPPPIDPVPHRQDTGGSESIDPRCTPGALSLQIPSRRTSFSDRSSPASPFPGYTESPLLLTPAAQTDPAEFFTLSGPARLEVPFAPYEIVNPKPVKWWPYAVLPPPHIFWRTLFPTLLGWQQKSHWDRFVSAISVPSILLLVLTLPVVESESPDDLSDDTMVDPLAHAPNPHVQVPDILPEGEPITQESEWQRFRRSTLSHSRMPSMDHSPKGSPALIAIDDPNGTRVATEAPTSHPRHMKPAAPLPSESSLAATDESGQWNRWLVAIQLFTGPLFAIVILWANMMEDFRQPYRVLVRFILYTLLGSATLLAILLSTTHPDKKPKFHFFLCFMGFIIAIAWISTIAGEVVGVLKAFGVLFGISEALLGLTIFAAGNSVGDLIANITVARLGYPVMALSACFGGPMLNILLGIGIGGVYMMVQAANHRHKKHPEKPIKYHAYQIQIGGTLMISAITLLVTLLGLLIIVPMNKWMMSRKIGYGLIAIWTVSTIVNVIIEVTGVWTDVSYSLNL
ncbi:putative cation exchanger [Colletotrichum spinosum]|uniref:Putative cation exchanger n=1 Tax=Colletotrichum spinosum TaxID=1347390 RepID=A0A4R8PVI8_9PEZI|nr:putative cation exchanger [Colletotrichum spinosum]